MGLTRLTRNRCAEESEGEAMSAQRGRQKSTKKEPKPWQHCSDQDTAAALINVGGKAQREMLSIKSSSGATAYVHMCVCDCYLFG